MDQRITPSMQSDAGSRIWKNLSNKDTKTEEGKEDDLGWGKNHRNKDIGTWGIMQNWQKHIHMRSPMYEKDT